MFAWECFFLLLCSNNVCWTVNLGTFFNRFSRDNSMGYFWNFFPRFIQGFQINFLWDFFLPNCFWDSSHKFFQGFIPGFLSKRFSGVCFHRFFTISSKSSFWSLWRSFFRDFVQRFPRNFPWNFSFGISPNVSSKVSDNFGKFSPNTYSISAQHQLGKYRETLLSILTKISEEPFLTDSFRDLHRTGTSFRNFTWDFTQNFTQYFY